ncbi:MAG: hypothetical protein QF615_00950, partial [Planctomycetota bacterium]|nr:hypothetical protein [Planctomycetota bacterium]
MSSKRDWGIGILGLGFMGLEMAFLQRFILYLAHPIYSAAAVIAGFLIFAGAGSRISRCWPWRPKAVAAGAAAVVVLLSIVQWWT